MGSVDNLRGYIVKKIYFLVLLSSCITSCYAFKTLDEASQYATTLPEAPMSDNNDWIDPEFLSVYHHQKSNKMQRLLERVGIIASPSWTPESFKQRLESLVDRSKKQTVQHQHLALAKNAKIFIVGDLHGAFHSLVRDLQQMRSQGVIDNDLELLDPNTHVVFLGDLVSRSPYSLQTLQLVMDLMLRNPRKVIYLRGNHETDAYWENFSMRRELQALASSVAQPGDGPIPLSTQINRFFATLPQYITVCHEGKPEEVFYIAHQRVREESINKEKKVHARLIGEKRMGVLGATKGLAFIGFGLGMSGWSILSCPTRVYQDFFKFHYDSFVALEMGATLQGSVLHHFYQDVSLFDKQFSQEVYDPILGVKLDEKKAKNRNIFSFGSTLALSGGLQSLGKGVAYGIESKALETNKNNDVAVRPVLLDDSYTPRFAQKNAKKLQNTYNVDVLLLPIGSPTLATYANSLKNMAVLFPITGGPQFRDPDLSSVVHFRTTYADEARALINHMIDIYNVKRFAFFYQEDDYGQPPLHAAHEALRNRGISTWTDIPYGREENDFTDAVKKLKESHSEAIGCFSVSAPTQEFISQVGAEYFLGRSLFGISALEDEAFQVFYQARGLPFIFSYVVPDAVTSDLPIIREYRASMDKQGRRYESNSLEGYIGTSLLLEALENIGLPFTAERILNFFQNLHKYDFKGLTLSFNPERRDLGQSVWIKTHDGEWIEFPAPARD